MRVLVLNCGSSSVKFAVFDTGTQQATASGLVENIGGAARIKAKGPQGKVEKDISGDDHSGALAAVQEFLAEQGEDKGIAAVGHRVVHGGERFSGSVLITPAVLEAVKECSPLAPLHNPANLLGIEVATRQFPHLPQVGVFDTAFHQTLPAHAYLYPLPYALYKEQGVRRYGFHGTSHRFVTAQAALQLGKKPEDLCIVTAHLGNGCSAAAVNGGRSVDTTMGLTPLEGLVMGTRSGTIDPGIPLFLHETLGYDFAKVNKLLNKESGLLGLSGLSNDMRTLAEASLQGHEGAKIAIEVFCYRLAKEIAGLAVALPRLDALVFTGGIGENSSLVRAKTLAHLSLLGFVLDESRNAVHGRESNGRISTDQSRMALVVATNEELLIALDAESLCQTK